MKVLLCPDKFKGSLSASGVCSALQEGLLSADATLEISVHPMADGGDGSVDILKAHYDLKQIIVDTVDPLGRAIKAHYYASDDGAFIELASASGITLLQDEERNPLQTTTLGTGMMIEDAIKRGFKDILLFIGGSATNDAGIGIAHALGFRFLDKNGDDLSPIGKSLSKVHSIKNNIQHDFGSIAIKVLCDVTNPMYGPNGAAMVYGAQKGASPEDIQLLDKGLINYANILNTHYQIDLTERPGMGAAGAVSASLVALLNAKIENGFQMLSEVTNLESAIMHSDLVITGEGKIDSTSFQGKVVGNVMRLCKKHKIPCGVVGGIVENVQHIKDEFVFRKSVIALASDLNDALHSPQKYLYQIGKNIVDEGFCLK